VQRADAVLIPKDRGHGDTIRKSMPTRRACTATLGVTRAWSERGASQLLAGVEILLSVVFFAATVAYARLTLVRR